MDVISFVLKAFSSFTEKENEEKEIRERIEQDKI